MTLKENRHLQQGLYADSSVQLAAAASTGPEEDLGLVLSDAAVSSHAKLLPSALQPQISLKGQCCVDVYNPALQITIHLPSHSFMET